MTHNDSIVNLVCCKLDQTPVSVSCGQGLSCAAACYAEQAVLCPSHDCENCENVDEEEEVEERVEKRKVGDNEVTLTERQGSRSWATQFSGAMKTCTRKGCPVRGRNKYCCFHPKCRKQKKRQCQWFQFFLGACFFFCHFTISSSFYQIYLQISKSSTWRYIMSSSASYCSRRMALWKTANSYKR